MQELPPLWVVFPKISPYDPCNQGMQEVYYRAWFYFWKELSQQQKDQYIIKWKASKEWIERLNSIDELINLDIEEDIRASEEWFDLIKHKEPLKKNSIFFKIKKFFGF